jgi:hypothetical protein
LGVDFTSQKKYRLIELGMQRGYLQKNRFFVNHCRSVFS